jgi:hypothetical protein
MTAIAGSVFTAAQFNQYVRDNLNMTCPALVTAAGQVLVSDAPNEMAVRIPTAAAISTLQTTTSNTYTNLATVGPTVTVTTGTQAIVFVTADVTCSSSGNAALTSYAVSGATTLAASDTMGFSGSTSGTQGTTVSLQTGLTPGSNTFTMQYRTGGGTGTFYNRALFVYPL